MSYTVLRSLSEVRSAGAYGTGARRLSSWAWGAIASWSRYHANHSGDDQGNQQEPTPNAANRADQTNHGPFDHRDRTVDPVDDSPAPRRELPSHGSTPSDRRRPLPQHGRDIDDSGWNLHALVHGEGHGDLD
jgi:hypothetical protein